MLPPLSIASIHAALAYAWEKPVIVQTHVNAKTVPETCQRASAVANVIYSIGFSASVLNVGAVRAVIIPKTAPKCIVTHLQVKFNAANRLLMLSILDIKP